MTEATNSQIAMWRAAISLAWADHILSLDEKEKLAAFFDKNLHLSSAQRDQLKADLDTKPDFNEAWNNISSKEDRAHLINIASSIFNSDGEYSEQEKAAYEKILSDHMATLDVNTAMEITKMATEMRKNRAMQDQEAVKNMSRVARFIYAIEEKLLG